MNRNFYEILGINKNATQDEIEKAYYAKLKIESIKEENSQSVQELNHIYTFLSNAQERKKYDSFLAEKNLRKNLAITEKFLKNDNNTPNLKQLESLIKKILAAILFVLFILNLATPSPRIKKINPPVVKTTQVNTNGKNRRTTLETELTNLEKYITSKKLELKNKYQLTQKLEEIKKFETNLKSLEKQHLTTTSKNLKKDILNNYKKLFASYEMALKNYNSDLVLYESEAEELNSRLYEYNQKVVEYNQLIQKIK